MASKQTCPQCHEPKALAVYEDGHSFCFNPACGYRTPPTDGSASEYAPREHKKVVSVIDIEPIGRAERDITPATFKRYGYGQSHYGKDAEPVHVWTIFGQDRQPLYNKLRFLTTKDFVALPIADSDTTPTEAQLWGMHVWGDQNDKRVVVTEGEIDAMSVAQAADFKYPVVSINGGAASAAKSLKANYRWLDRFTEIILWFDQDDAGLKAVAECAPLFASGKVKIAKVDGFKDANEVLAAKRKADIELAIYGAMTWAPAGIVNAADAAGTLMTDGEVPMWAYPWAGLQTYFLGVHRGDVIYDVAGTGIGKSSAINEFIDFWLFGEGHTEAPAHIGIMAFETLLRDTQLGILSVHASQRLHIEPMPKADLLKLHAEVFGSRRVEMFDPETADWGFEPLVSYARYMVKALDCNILIIDPLSFLAAQLPDADERRALDKVAVTFAKLAKELGCAIHICHHLTRPDGDVGHEEGAKTSIKQLRGSGGMANFAVGVIGYERNQQAEGQARLLTTVRVLKNRITGETGVAGYTLYDPETGRTNEITAAEAASIQGGGSSEPDRPFTKANQGPDDSEY